MSDPIDVAYEVSGFFDKDAQGWCASLHRVRIDGDRVLFSRWYDENGNVRVSEDYEGEVVARDGERLTVRFPRFERVFDRARGRFDGDW